MDFAGLSDARRAHPVARHTSNLGSDRWGRIPHSRAARDASVADAEADAFETADRRQAAYFLWLLVQNRRLSEERIDKFHTAIAACEADGDAEGATGFRRLLRNEQQDRQALDEMLENLHRRFPRGTPLAVR